DRRNLRHELHERAGAALALGILVGAGVDGDHRHPHVVLVPPEGMDRPPKVMRIVVMASPSFEALGRLPRDRGVEFLIAHDPDSFRRLLPGAEVALIAPRYGALIRDAWPDMGGIRWIHALGAGVEHFPFDLLRRRDIVVTNSRGVYAEALAEFVIAAMLWFAKDLR